MRDMTFSPLLDDVEFFEDGQDASNLGAPGAVALGYELFVCLVPFAAALTYVFFVFFVVSALCLAQAFPVFLAPFAGVFARAFFVFLAARDDALSVFVVVVAADLATMLQPIFQRTNLRACFAPPLRQLDGANSAFLAYGRHGVTKWGIREVGRRLRAQR
jgi:hypothetical protein